MTTTTDEALIQAAANVLVRSALNLIQKDPHQWSQRPCPTCNAVGVIIGEPFGCYLEQAREREYRKSLASTDAKDV